MKFLVDESLSVQISSALREAGHDAAHVFDRGLGGSPDTDVSALAAAEGRAVISADSDFTTMLASVGTPRRRWSCSGRSTNSSRPSRPRS